MKKFLYGIFDVKTGNFGDICILDRDEEFRDGCIKLFSDNNVPDYIVRDLRAVRYGSISYDPDHLYPKIDPESVPRIILSGSDFFAMRSADALPLKLKEDISHETVIENS